MHLRQRRSNLTTWITALQPASDGWSGGGLPGAIDRPIEAAFDTDGLVNVTDFAYYNTVDGHWKWSTGAAILDENSLAIADPAVDISVYMPTGSNRLLLTAVPGSTLLIILLMSSRALEIMTQ